VLSYGACALGSFFLEYEDAVLSTAQLEKMISRGLIFFFWILEGEGGREPGRRVSFRESSDSAASGKDRTKYIVRAIGINWSMYALPPALPLLSAGVPSLCQKHETCAFKLNELEAGRRWPLLGMCLIKPGYVLDEARVLFSCPKTGDWYIRASDRL
jgi:hypothetical protein